MRHLILILSIALAPMLATAGDAPPSSFMKLEVGVLRHYGSTSGYGFTLLQYVDAMKPTGGKQEWKKDNDKQWTHSISIDDNATGAKQRMALVFKEDGKYATIIRFVDNDKEVTKDYIGTAADQIMLPIAQKLSSGMKSSAASAKSIGKKSAQSTNNLPGTYECTGADGTVKIESIGTNQIRLSYINACGDKQLSFSDLPGKLKCTGDACKATLTSGKCTLFLYASKESPNEVSVYSEDVEADKSYDCCNDKHRIINATCRKPVSTPN